MYRFWYVYMQFIVCFPFKLQTTFTRFMELNDLELTGTELISLGEFACGMTVEGIADLDPTHYMYDHALLAIEGLARHFCCTLNFVAYV